jgi:hypothetical protein
MMKALKAGLFGLAMGTLGAVAIPSQEAEAQLPPSCFPTSCVPAAGCCSECNPNYQRCLTSAGNNTSNISRCVQLRSYCESHCFRTC